MYIYMVPKKLTYFNQINLCRADCGIDLLHTLGVVVYMVIISMADWLIVAAQNSINSIKSMLCHIVIGQI